MKIGIYTDDIRIEDGGGSTLTRTLIGQLRQRTSSDFEYAILYTGGRKKPYKKVVDGIDYINVDKILNIFQDLWSKADKIIGFSSKWLRFDMIADKEGIDLFFFVNNKFADISYPFIYTVWDLGHRVVPYFPEVSRGHTWQYRENMFRKMIEKSSYIITGCEEGRREILENYSVSSAKIRTVPFPISEFCFGKEEKPEWITEGQYFFYPAQFWAHKNHICILDALVILRAKYGLQPIVYLTGSDKGNKEYIQRKVNEAGLQDQVVFTGFLSEEEMKYLYTHASAMVYASLMGPNNLPPIEATYLACPIIITNLPGHIEQLEDAALYFDGYKPEELAYNMMQILTEPKLRESLLEKEKILAKRFEKVDYWSEIVKIFEEFEEVRRRWG